MCSGKWSGEMDIFCLCYNYKSEAAVYTDTKMIWEKPKTIFYRHSLKASDFNVLKFLDHFALSIALLPKTVKKYLAFSQLIIEQLHEVNCNPWIINFDDSGFLGLSVCFGRGRAARG